MRIDERTVDSPAKIGSHGEPTWYELGRNHRVENGHIMRDFDDTAWFIEMNSLDDLIAFHKAHGDLVISDGFTRITRIEIYDDYRE